MNENLSGNKFYSTKNFIETFLSGREIITVRPDENYCNNAYILNTHISSDLLNYTSQFLNSKLKEYTNNFYDKELHAFINSGTLHCKEYLNITFSTLKGNLGALSMTVYYENENVDIVVRIGGKKNPEVLCREEKESILSIFGII